MIEEARYYTPTEKDIRIGLKFQLSNKPESDDHWYDACLNRFDVDRDGCGPVDDFLFGVYNKSIRVKYLNKSDLESLNWHYSYENQFKYKNIKSGNSSYKLNFSLYGEVPWIKIQLVGPDHKDYIIFEGKIRNINEMKDIMEKLAII